MAETMWRNPIAARPDLTVDSTRPDASALRTLADLRSLADLASDRSEQAQGTR
jgi:hypothetical protein